MQVINVKDNNEAAKKALKITLKACEELNRKFDLALTGGRFGEAFVKHLATSNFPFGKCRIFQTDERYVPIADDESIQGMLNKELIKVDENIQGCCYFFGILSDPKKSIIAILNTIRDLNIQRFDLTVLSLGEDGHIAGDFESSRYFENKIAWTRSASKFPRKRISFSVDWLVHSNVVILTVVGAGKSDAFRELMSGNGYHSDLLKKKRGLIILKDKNISY